MLKKINKTQFLPNISFLSSWLTALMRAYISINIFLPSVGVHNWGRTLLHIQAPKIENADSSSSLPHLEKWNLDWCDMNKYLG